MYVLSWVWFIHYSPPPPHRGCHRQEGFLSSSRRRCRSSRPTRRGWSRPSRRRSDSCRHRATDPGARSLRCPAAAELDTRRLKRKQGGRGRMRREKPQSRHMLHTIYWMHHQRHCLHYLCMWHVAPVCRWLISWATTPHQGHRPCRWRGTDISPGHSEKSARCPPAPPVVETCGDKLRNMKTSSQRCLISFIFPTDLFLC